MGLSKDMCLGTFYWQDDQPLGWTDWGVNDPDEPPDASAAGRLVRGGQILNQRGDRPTTNTHHYMCQMNLVSTSSNRKICFNYECGHHRLIVHDM